MGSSIQKDNEWQDISTVPLDIYVLFYFHFEKDDDYSQVCIASFETNELFYYDTNGNDICNTPTHWKLLPTPPEVCK